MGETTTMTVQEMVDAAAEGKDPLGYVEIYWSAGPAYQVSLSGEDFRESGPLQLMGWSRTDGNEDDTYSLFAYFNAGGAYLGPDQHGVHPTFRVA